MVKFGRFIAKHRVLILIIAVLLMIPSVFGYVATRVNYDILTYLPDNIDTMVGQDLLMDEFGKGGFSMVVVNGLSTESTKKMCDEISNVDGVADVISYSSLVGTKIPEEIISDDLKTKFQKGDSELVVVFFTEGTSSDKTLEAIASIRSICGKNALVGSMSAIIADTRDLCEKEEPIYVLIAVVLCAIVLAVAMDSPLLPVFFLLSIGMAIIYNLGSNIFLGQISYITQAWRRFFSLLLPWTTPSSCGIPSQRKWKITVTRMRQWQLRFQRHSQALSVLHSQRLRAL